MSLLLAYGAPALPLAALQLPIYIFLPTVYAQTLGLGFAAVGTVLLIARLIDAVSDPFIGYFSDATRSRFGRRKLWSVAGGPLVLIGAVWLLFPGEQASLTGLLIGSVLLYVGWTMVILPLNAWGAELSPDYDERSRIAGYREGFTVAGSLLALGLIATAAPDGEDGRSALNLLGWTIVILLPLGLAAAAWRVPDPLPRKTAPLPLRERFGIILGNRPFLRLIFAYLVNGVANGLPATLFVLFVSAGLGEPDAVGPLLFLYFLCGLLAVPLWLWLSYRYGKHRTWCGAMIWASVVFAFTPLLGPGDLIGFTVICVLTGAALGADIVLPASMQADVVDQDTAVSGEARTGLYFAFWSMATKLALALAVGIAFPLLGLVGLDATAGTDADTVEGGARWMLVGLYALAPIVFKSVAITLIWGHPLDAKKVAETRAVIDARG